VGLIDKFDGIVGASFGFSFDGHTVKAITEISGLKEELEIAEFKSQTSDGKFVNTKIPVVPKSGTVTVSRALSEDTAFADWVKEAREGKLPRANAEIVVYDTMLTPIMRYTLLDCQPTSNEVGTLKAGAPDVVTEKMTLHHVGINVEKG
jgi:phage tail-like protein